LHRHSASRTTIRIHRVETRNGWSKAVSDVENQRISRGKHAAVSYRKLALRLNSKLQISNSSWCNCSGSSRVSFCRPLSTFWRKRSQIMDCPLLIFYG
jgi:hypothetical protein